MVQMKDFFGIVEYFFLVGVPGYAARYLTSEHPLLAFFVFLFGCYAALMRYAASSNHEDLKKARQDLYTIEKKHYLESQANKIACGLLNDDQTIEYIKVTREKHLDPWLPYTYQEFEPWKYEQEK